MRRHEHHITQLEKAFNEREMLQLEELHFDLALEYCYENPGRYYLALPGELLPLSSLSGDLMTNKGGRNAGGVLKSSRKGSRKGSSET